MKTAINEKESKGLKHYLGLALIYGAGLTVIALQLRSLL